MALGLDPLRSIRGVGIDQYKAGLGEYLDQVASDAWASGPLSQGTRLLEASFTNENARDSGDQLLTAKEASDQGRDLGLRFDQPIAQGAYNVLADEKRRQAAAETTFQRARLENGYGTLHWLLGGGTEFLAQAVDPLNIASAFVPIVGEARYAAIAARVGRPLAGLARGAIEGAGGQALLEPINALERRQQGEDYGMLNTLMDVGFGGGLGVALHGAAYGLGAGFRFIRDRYAASPSAVSDRAAPPVAERSAIPSPPRGEEPPTITREEGPPPRQPVAEAMEQLRPETKDAAMRTAVAQLAQDKPVDLEPVLAADPNWPAVKAAIEAGHAQQPELQAQSVAASALPKIEPPADFRPTPEEKLAATRAVRGWTPEAPLDEPQSLSDFVKRAGGVKADTSEAGDLLAADNRQAVGKRGNSTDELARAAQENGFRFGNDTGVGNGIDVKAFERALEEDASGRVKHYPDDSHTEAWRAQQEYFQHFAGYLRDTLGLDPRGMDPNRLAWIMRQDEHTARLIVLLDKADRLGPDDSLELAHRLDREAAALEREVLDREDDSATIADHRDTPPATLEELEAFYAAHHSDALEPGAEGGRPAGDGSRPGGQAEGGEAAAARSGAPDDPAEEARLRREGQPRAGTAEPGTAADLSRFAERQQAADLHADVDALGVRDERLAGEAREVQQLLADDLRDFGPALDEDTRALVAETGKVFDDEAKALDALASCQARGTA